MRIALAEFATQNDGTLVLLQESFSETLSELDPLYRRHYAEMTTRLDQAGIKCSPYNPRIDQYIKASEGGWLLTYVLRREGVAVGYSNVYVTNDMHNGDLIAQEDTIYITPENRGLVGKKMITAIQNDLRARGCLRINITTSTDLRVATLLKRMGYRHTAHAMTFDLTRED